MGKITRREFVQGAALAPLALTPLSLPHSSDKGERFDIVVAGAGHNSLITGCYLAKAGYRVLVLEAQSMIGGSTKTAPIILSGVYNDLCSTEHIVIQDNPLLRDDELHLKEYGLEYIHPDPIIHVPFPDGTYITQWQDFDRTCDEIAKYSKKDAATYRHMTAEVEPIWPIIHAYPFSPPGWAKTPAQIIAANPKWKERWVRRMGMTPWDILHDHFENWRTITFMMAPWADTLLSFSAGLKAYRRCKLHQTTPLPKGGSGMLPKVLARYLEAHGGVILRDKEVVRLVVENGKCTGVECADGSTYRAKKAVVSTMHVKDLVKMAPSQLWGEDFLDGVDTYTVGPGTLVTHLVTTEPLKFQVEGGTLIPVHATTLSSPERGLRYNNELKLGLVDLEDPVLHTVQCTVADPSRAPDGLQTIRIAGTQPYSLKDGGPERWDKIKDQVADAYIKALRRLSPNLTDDKILGRVVWNPVDHWRKNACCYEGSCNETEGSAGNPGQMGPNRPVPGWADYRMPIPGLYQTGLTTFPGGRVTGAPGRNAAMVMLKDFGTSLEEVLQKKG